MKTLIIEDEPAAARRLSKLVRRMEPAATMMGELDSVAACLNYFAANPQPELIFMDIQLADGSSFDLLERVDITCPIIFTTAYDEYALKAFESHAIDYLLKPIKADELQRALEKYRQLGTASPRLNYRELAEGLRSADTEKRFLIRVGQHLRVVEMADVAYFYTEDKITFLTTFAGKRYPLDYTLDQLVNMTNGREFFRINRQFIVRLSAISEMLAYSKSRVKLTLKPPCVIETIVSTERSPHFKRWLEG